MNTQHERNTKIREAYFKIINEITRLSRSFSTPQLRTRIEIDHSRNKHAVWQAYEFLTPYLYLQLDAHPDGQACISYSSNEEAIRYLGFNSYTQVIRSIYKHTAGDIDDCLEVFYYTYERYEDALEDIRNETYDFYTQTEEPYQEPA